MPTHYTISFLSAEWFLSSGITIVGIVFFLFFVKQFFMLHEPNITKGLGCFLLATVAVGQVYLIVENKWKMQSSMPLHLCGLSAILSGVLLIKPHQTAYECLFYWGIPGATHSLLTPEMTQGAAGFLYPEYFISHGGIILSALYLTLIIGLKPRQHSWWNVFLYTQFLASIIFAFNYLIGANYMYLSAKPVANNPLIIGDWPWYIGVLEVVALIHFLIIYFPFWLQYRKKEQLN
jgi:hypothetical integral membrane protein (TIGR02206 family)